jgi:hypothetical protein
MEMIGGLIAAQVFILVLGICLGALCAGGIYLITRKTPSLQRNALIVAFQYPFWAMQFVFWALITYAILMYAAGKESWLDGAKTDLGNGYSLIYDAEFGGYVRDGSKTIRLTNVQEFQVAGNTVLVTYHSGSWGHGDAPPDSYAAIDTRSGEIIHFSSREHFKKSLKGEGLALKPARSIGSTDWRFVFLLLSLLLTALGAGGYLLHRLRENQKVVLAQLAHTS